MTETAAGQVAQYTYDNNGNTLSRVSATDKVFYTWDFENRLVAADTNGDGTVDERNVYDADGNRVSQAAGGQETRFLIDTVRPVAQVLLEYRPSGLITASYVYGNRLISQTRGGVQSFYHVDGLGSTRALTGAAGLVTDRYVYDAFGIPLSSQGTTPNPYRFLGEQLDPNPGLIYLRARYLIPPLGRFASRDPFPGLSADPMSLHRYLYVHADPVNRIDPTGQFDLLQEVSAVQIVTILAGASIGSVVGGYYGYKWYGNAGLWIGAIGGAFLGAILANSLLNVFWGGGGGGVGGAGGSKISADALAQSVWRKLGTPDIPTKLGAVVPPFLPWVELFRRTREDEPNGDEALRTLAEVNNELKETADPYTGEYYRTLAASLEAAGIKVSEP